MIIKMDNYLVSARKYRPSTFKSVVGQKALTATLKNSIATDRLAHAYLFCGSRGVGKTSCARIFAKTINCEHRTPDGDACNQCASCRDFNEGRSLNIVELDAASNNSVDDIRSLVDQVLVPPTSGRYRVFIVDEVHMLSTAAFNAFLKTLEEPPSYVVFVLATTEKHKIIPTILSRCQIYDFNRITIQDMIDHLSYVAEQEGITVEQSALNVIAQKADGAMRDALSIFDQVAASSMGNITYASTIDNLNVLDSAYYNRLLEAFLSQNVPDALLIYKEIRDKGFDSHFFITGLGSYFRDLMVAGNPSTICLLEASDEAKNAMAAIASRCTPQFIYKAMDLCNDADFNYRLASNKQFLIELTLIKLCQLLSPSPNSGDGEGQLKKIEPVAQSSTATPAYQAPAVAPVATTPQPTHAPALTITGAPAPAPRTTIPAPAPQAAIPAPRPVAQPTTVRRPASPTATISIRNKAAADTTNTPSATATRVELRNNSYSDSALDMTWETYIQSHPTSHILINTMRMARPQRIGEHLYLVKVENPGQQTLMEQAMPDIMDHIHRSLGNDYIKITIAINEGEAAPHTWNEREVLNHIIETTPYFKTFCDDLGLKLS